MQGLAIPETTNIIVKHARKNDTSRVPAFGRGWLPLNALDLSNAIVVAPAEFTGPERKAVELLVDEVAQEPKDSMDGLASGRNPAIRIQRGSGPAEGYSIRTDANGITISGNDGSWSVVRIGHLLRSLEFSTAECGIAPHL